MTDHEANQLNQVIQKLDELLDWKNGMGGDPGINIRIDRLEQQVKYWRDRADKMGNWISALLCGGGVTAVVAVLAFIKNLK